MYCGWPAPTTDAPSPSARTQTHWPPPGLGTPPRTPGSPPHSTTPHTEQLPQPSPPTPHPATPDPPTPKSPTQTTRPQTPALRPTHSKPRRPPASEPNRRPSTSAAN